MERITVLGAGIMGHGIAQLCAQVGKDIRVFDTQESSLEHAKKMIHNSLAIMVEKEIFTADEMAKAEAALSYTTNLEEAVKDSEMVIEVVPEKIEIKMGYLRKS